MSRDSILVMLLAAQFLAPFLLAFLFSRRSNPPSNALLSKRNPDMAGKTYPEKIGPEKIWPRHSAATGP